MEQENRRNFLKTTGAALAAGSTLVRGQASNAIKIGLVGCGGRGTGAASQAMKADDYAELTAVADVSQEQVDKSLEQLTKINGAKVKVDPKNQFLGLDAYQKGDRRRRGRSDSDHASGVPSDASAGLH